MVKGDAIVRTANITKKIAEINRNVYPTFMRYNPEEYKRNKEKYIERQKRYRGGKNREQYLAKAKKRSREWYKNNKEKRYEYNRQWWKKHIEELGKLVGRPRPHNCEICGQEGVIVFDHDHNTGKFRGWICERCNTVLGKVKDDIGTLNDLIKYLKKSK
mgnify:CR=1 FL=1